MGGFIVAASALAISFDVNRARVVVYYPAPSVLRVLYVDGAHVTEVTCYQVTVSGAYVCLLFKRSRV